MGCTQSVSFQINPAIVGQGPEIRVLAQKLAIPEPDIDKYYNAFNKLDPQHTGYVTLDHLHEYYHIEKSVYSMKAFSFMVGESKEKSLNFREYIISLWNYLSCDVDHLAKFSFVLYDLDNSNILETLEVEAMVESVYGRKIDQHEKVGKVLVKLDLNKDGRITRDEFIKFSKQYPLILYPAFVIQEKLRSDVFGTNYWEEEARRRTHAFADQSIFEILKD